jgi:type IV pilus assembly protein PilB
MYEVCSNSAELESRLQSVQHDVPIPMQVLLLEDGRATPDVIDEIFQEQGSSSLNVIKLGNVLSRRGIMDDEDFSRLVARSMGLPFVQLSSFDISQDIISMVPVNVAREHELIPLIMCGEKLVVAMRNPMDREAMAMLSFLSAHMVEEVVSSRADILHAITRFYGPGDDESVMQDIQTPVSTNINTNDAEALRLAGERPTVRLVHHMILDAINSRASDIHVRPCEDRADLLFRIDGSLVRIRSFNKSLLPAVVSRIKILSCMNVAEHRLPQDGQARVKHFSREIDMRVSVMPTVHGESVVIRILDKSVSLRQMSDVGLTPDDQQIFSALLRRSQGMILVTGPTGCGKSTTLYAALQDVISTGRNIITVEDPVEYHVDGLMQIQVNHGIGYSFARALRHILRHDPDVIMVGEIRDMETARMAVESSLTGHIVLSTLHTNSAATSLTRLIEMGVEPYLVNTSLLAIMAQRLVRKNCTYCMVEEPVTEDVRTDLGLQPDEIFWRGQGCEHCYKTGYHGRMAIYELLTITPNLRRMIHLNAEAAEIERQAIADGMLPLTQMALQAARERKTSIAEVYRSRIN